MWIREAQKHTDPTDPHPDSVPDPEHWSVVPYWLLVAIVVPDWSVWLVNDRS
jgi:hypothetical protein